MVQITGVTILYLQILFTVKIVTGWSWYCSFDDTCQRTISSNGNQETFPSLELCQLACGKSTDLNIWPYPTGPISSSKYIAVINPENIHFKMTGPEGTTTFLSKVVEYFKEKIEDYKLHDCQTFRYEVDILLHTMSGNVSLTLDTDESYTLQTTTSDSQLNIQIVGNTVFGVRHGIETLLQLLIPYEDSCLATLKSVQIADRPVYRHRGLLLDTARNYLSIDIIKKNLDGMAASKLNVFHWHITDSQSFPLQSPSLPNMTRYGAYSDKNIYTPLDIQHLVDYAKIRGIRILLEIDGPSHAGSGWQWGEDAGLGNLAVCVNKQPWRSFCIQPPCGQLNPANPNLYNVLKDLYRDIAQMNPNTDIFHMGGDEVFIPCWNSTKEIIDYLKEKPLTEETFLELWGEYQRKALAAYDSAVGHSNTSIVVWTSHLTEPNIIEKYLPKNRFIIQTWIPESSEELITSLLNLGYKLIISTKDRWYLDHGFWGTTPFYNWRKVYENKMYRYRHASILGGEVCMWGELVDDYNVEPRVWPRAAAAAERLWTNPTSDSRVAETRFFAHRERLLTRGIKAEAEIPRWCIQNEGGCSAYL